MARLRSLVAAGWVVATIAGPVAVVPAASAGARDVRTPGVIDATGATDVTADLQALMDRTPDGGVVQLEREGDYRVEGTLVLDERHDLRIEGNGARIFATSTADRSRSHLKIVGGSDLVVHNLEIHGANPHAGLGDQAHVADLEAQHGIALEGVTDVELNRVYIHDTYGDNVYVSRHEGDRRWSERVWIHDSTFARTGRQGIAVVAARDVVIERNWLTHMRRAAIDLEPTTQSWGADNIHILDNLVGPGRLLFVAAAGAGPVNWVVIARNSLQGRDLGVWVVPPEGDRRQRFWVVDNTSDTPSSVPTLRFTRSDGVIVHGNTQPISGRGKAFVKAVDSCDVAITGNDIAPGTVTLEGQSRKCNFILPVEPPEPPRVAGRDRERAEGAPPTEPATGSAPSTSTAPTTAAPTNTPPSRSPTSRSPTSQAQPSTETLAATPNAAESGGVSVPVVALAMVLSAAAGAGATAVLNARRGRR
jgi:Right handed beta helix region